MEEIKNVFFDFCTNIRNGVATFETEEDNINQIIEFCSEVSAEVKNNNLESVKKLVYLIDVFTFFAAYVSEMPWLLQVMDKINNLFCVEE